MWKIFLGCLLVFCASCQEVCQKDDKNCNLVDQCNGSKKTNLINNVKMIKIAEKVMMPQIGYGTWKVMGDEPIYKGLEAALDSGYRLIDTAVVYGNHRSIAKALKTLLPERNLSRKDIFITTKIPTVTSVNNPEEEPNLSDCMNGVKNMLSELDTNYIDLLLIHSPPRSEQERKESWQCLEHYYQTGEAKSIGVSNYQQAHLEEILKFGKIKPHVNQILYNPLVATSQASLVEYCKEKKIHMTAYTSLGNYSPNRLLNSAPLYAIGQKYGKSTAHILLRWATQQGFSVIPKSLSPDHIKQNINLDFKLKKSDMSKITHLFKICLK